MTHWLHDLRENSVRAWEWCLGFVTISGAADSVRDSLHGILGLWGDIAGALVALFTVILFGLRAVDQVRLRLRRCRSTTGSVRADKP